MLNRGGHRAARCPGVLHLRVVSYKIHPLPRLCLFTQVPGSSRIAQAAAAEASSRSAEEVASLRARVAELEGKLAVLESRSVRGSEEARLRVERNRSPAAASAGRG